MINVFFIFHELNADVEDEHKTVLRVSDQGDILLIRTAFEQRRYSVFFHRYIFVFNNK